MSDETPTMFTDDEPAGPAPIVIDRSTLERYAECPQQGYQVERGHVASGSADTDVGNAVHDVLALAVRARHEQGHSAKDLRDLIQERALRSRPDVQPAVVESLRRSYAIADFLCHHAYGPERAPDDILRYDGGEGPHAGQLAGDLIPAAEDGSRGPVRLTAELDLLMAGASAEEVELSDWKSGWRHWTAGEVAESFQFNFYAWLVFRCYPNVRRVRVKVFMTREGTSTSVVEFLAERMFAVHQRLISAAAVYLKYHKADTHLPIPAWPSPGKCSLCPAASQCPKVHAPAGDLAQDPEGYVRQYAAILAAAEQMKQNLTRAVRVRGVDFAFGSVAFGTGKPVKPRARDCDLYEIGKT